jgi:deoxyadenosine/deoxycytidine kinase
MRYALHAYGGERSVGEAVLDKRARIEICGGIAAGKTSLAKRLCSTNNFVLIQESYRGVPFWERFYKEPSKYALEKNLGFMLSHADLIPEQSPAHVVCDFAMFQDIAYARLGPSKDLDYISELYRRLVSRMGRPNLIINVGCSIKSQLERILARGRSVERAISGEYLKSLNDSINDQLAILAADHSIHILHVDTDVIDCRVQSLAYEQLESDVSSTVSIIISS